MVSCNSSCALARNSSICSVDFESVGKTLGARASMRSAKDSLRYSPIRRSLLAYRFRSDQLTTHISTGLSTLSLTFGQTPMGDLNLLHWMLMKPASLSTSSMSFAIDHLNPSLDNASFVMS